VSEHGGFHAGTADFVDGGCRDGVGKARAEGCLARRRLTLSRGQDATEEHFLDSIGWNGGALNAGANGEGAKLGSGKIFEVALEAADGSPRGANDNDGVMRGHSLLL
jgi:hypothetical protein